MKFSHLSLVSSAFALFAAVGPARAEDDPPNLTPPGPVETAEIPPAGTLAPEPADLKDAKDPPLQESRDPDAPRARISFLEGELRGRNPRESQDAILNLNAVVVEGDELRTGLGTFAEVELPEGSFLRLGPGARAVVDGFSKSVHVTLIEGAAYYSRGPGAPEAVLVSPASRVIADDSAMFRVDLVPQAGRLSIRIARGAAQVESGADRRSLSAGQTLVWDQGNAEIGKWDPTKGDAFDRWSFDRERKEREYRAPDRVSREHYQGLYDLEGQGDWVYADESWYWRPYVAADWRPYYDGSWSWYGSFGWTWIPVVPWGYVTHHYGRWSYLAGRGWCWAPHPGWRGAWVSWAVVDHHHLGWAPCDLRGRAVSRHGLGYDPGVWSFAHPRSFVAAAGASSIGGRTIRDHIYTLPRMTDASIATIQHPRFDLAPVNHAADASRFHSTGGTRGAVLSRLAATDQSGGARGAAGVGSRTADGQLGAMARGPYIANDVRRDAFRSGVAAGVRPSSPASTPYVRPSAPIQAYGRSSPVQSYVRPSAPAQSYVWPSAPAQTWSSRPSYVRPSAPIQSYSRPAPSYRSPASFRSWTSPSYSSPSQRFSSPSRPSYSAPRPSYSAPHPSSPAPSYHGGGGGRSGGGGGRRR